VQEAVGQTKPKTQTVSDPDSLKSLLFPPDTGKYKPTTKPKYRPSDRQGDPFSSKEEASPLLLDNPSNITTKVVLDSNTNTYTILEKVGDLDYRPVSTMTFEEYSRWKMKESMKSYIKAKSDANGNSALKNNRLVPLIYISSGLDRIFGGNQVDIRPNGSVVLDFGWQQQRTFNPSLPLRQQSSGQFLFDQQINLNVQGKIGEKLKLSINYDTKATFEFENQVKIDYTGLDHEILQKIEAGNVSLPISSSLITGAQNLFGLKTTMRFGRLKVVAVISNQRGKADKVTVKGGASSKDLNIRANEYEANKHFFLSQFFRNNFEKALANPTIPGTTSGVIIRRVELYVTNRANATTGLRNIAGFIDLGEGSPYRQQWQGAGQDSTTAASNTANGLFNQLYSNQDLRNAENTRDKLLGAPYNFTQSTDFEVVRQARKLEAGRDFTFHENLGYVSLNSSLNFDEVLGVAFQYTYNGVTYQVGELQNDIASRAQDEVILLKLIRPAILNVRLPTWNLQMKNIYNLGVSQISKDGFSVKVIYRDDSSGVDNPVLRQGVNVREKQLVTVFKVDQLNQAGERGSDGLYDFVDGITVDSKNGRIIFPVLEPFGKFLRRQFDPYTEQNLINKYVFDELYRGTYQDALQAANKNKFAIVGKIASSSSTEISLPGVNISPGSVQVFAGSEMLQENSQYTVDYSLGKVRILDAGVLASGREISIRYEKADLFSFQRRTFMGTRLDYTISNDINLGATLLYLNETPLIKRQSVGDEPASNLMVGIDANYKKDSRLITKLVDKLPFYSTKETSSIQASGEYARMFPGVSKFVDATGGGISYIDDFEGVRTPTSLGSQPHLWKYASAPFKYKAGLANPIAQNYRRARLAWYSIDNIFFLSSGANRPTNINTDDLKNPYQRPIPYNEIFPNRDPNAINLNEQTFDLAFYPSERGMYNYNPDLENNGTLKNPTQSYGSVMRAITTNTDFDASNIEYVEFWMLDPFKSGAGAQVGDNQDGSLRTGELTFDLGVMTEDALEDNLQSFENGLPAPGQTLVTTNTTRWGKVTRSQHITNAFVNTAGSRSAQDVGLDGLDDISEQDFFTNNSFGNNFLQQVQGNVTPEAYQKILSDPSADNFSYYLGGDLDNVQTGPKIIDRYKFYNGLQGNSPEANGAQSFIPSATQLPDNEDLNGDNTVSNTDSYYSYKVKIDPAEFEPGRNYIVDKISPGGQPSWYLFRIPIRDINHPNFAGKTGTIADFKTMRFIRATTSGFQVPVVLRMAQFQMVASTWRPYPKPLTPPRAGIIDQDDASLTVGTVNIEENGQPADGKVAYIVPPGLPRDRDVTSGVNRRLNEQSLSIIVNRLRDSDSKAVFKNTKLDFLNYKRIRMWISAYANEPRTKDNEVSAFIRFGTDFTENFYEIEIPLKLAPTGVSGIDPWFGENELNIELNKLYAAKIRRNRDSIPITGSSPFYPVEGTRQRISVCGNPDLNMATVVMLGVRNNTSSDRRAKSVTVWFDELRVTDFDKNDGYAATGRVSLKLADLGTITATARYIGLGFGSIEQKISERSRTEQLSFQASAQLNLHKFTPKSFGLRLPMYVSYDITRITPKFDQLNPDIPLAASLESFATDDPRRSYYEHIQKDIQVRRSINFTNIGKDRTNNKRAPAPWDVENLNFTYAYSETKRTNINLEDYFSLQINYGMGYTFSTGAKPLEPFKGLSKSPWLKWLTEFNLSYLPSNVSARADLERRWTKTQLRSSNVFATGRDNPIAPTFEKAYTMNRTYGLQVSPFKSLSVNYTANVQALIDELGDTVGTDKMRQAYENKNLRKFGRVKVFNQTFRANYAVPFSKIPLTDFLRADLTYSTTFNWQANQLAIADTLGNIVQNTRDRSVNAQVDLVKLYNKVKFLNTINNPPPTPPAPIMKLDPKTGKPAKDTTKKKPNYGFFKGIARFIMGVKNVQGSYQVTENTTLPGYLPTVDLFGYNFGKNNPNWFDFLAGSQDPTVRTRLRDQGLIARSPSQTQPFTQSRTENLTMRATLEPIKDFTVQLDAKVATNANYSEIYRNTRSLSDVPNFQSQSASRTGSFTMSYIALNTSWDKDDADFRTSAFKQFETNRSQVRSLLQTDIPRGRGSFDTNSQDVIIPAFLAAYSGKAVDNNNLSPFPKFPLPNWNINYSGLQRIPWVADKFSSVTLSHKYSSTYTVANYSANTNYDLSFFQLNRNLNDYNNLRPTLKTVNGNRDSIFQPVIVINSIIISERFGPLIGINIRTKKKLTIAANYNRGRDISLSVANSQITEMNTQDVTFSFGYAKSGMKLPFRNKGRIIVLDNEVQFKCDVTFRDTKTTQRQLEQAGQVTAGMQDLQIKPTINYVLNTRMNIQFYLEHTRNIPRISQSYERRNTRFGIQLRINLM